MTTTLTRAELAKAVGSDPKIVRAFEQLQQSVSDVVATTANNVAATEQLQDATAITLSPDAALANARVLAVGTGLQIIDQGAGKQVILQTISVALTQGGYRCTLNLNADTNLTLPASGTVLTDDYFAGGPYASDSAAAADGVAVGQPYRKTGGTVAWRQS